MKKKRRTPTADDLRHEAEARLRCRRQRDVDPAAAEGEAARLLHELEVHQIELEMQNEELRRTQDELEESRAKYFSLYDLAPVGYLMVDGEGLIVEANLTAARMLRPAKRQLVREALTRFILKEDQDLFYLHQRALFETDTPQTCELRMKGAGGARVWMRLDANLLQEAASGQPVCRVVMTDITAQKEADEALRHMATHDTLTGLYTRGFFVEEMERIERGRRFPVSIVVADVDDMKETNDRHGHAAGDALLVRVAQVLTAAFRAEDVVARIGGDEFAILLPATEAASVAVSLRRVREGILADNASHPETPLRLSLGAGTAECPGPLGVVLKAADAEMYSKKRSPDTTS